MMPQPKVTTLPGGVVAITEELPYVQSASIGVWVDRGSRDETPENNGISHFFEHMVFKGTQKRSAFEIVHSLESIGGQINAFTSKEQTCFYARVVDTQVKLAIDVLLDMVLCPSFDAKELEKERDVVVEEIKGSNDNPDERVYDLYNQSIYGNQSSGFPIAGTVESVKGLTRKQLLEHLDAVHDSAPLFIVAVGNINHDEVCDSILNVLDATGKSSFSNGLVRMARAEEDIQYQRQHLIENMDVQQATVSLGGPSYTFLHSQAYPLALANAVLGEGMSSILFQDLREKFGYVYQISTFSESMVDSGIFGINFNTEPKYLTPVFEEINNILSRVKKEGFTKEQLEFAKAYVIGNFALEQESTQSRMAYLARMYLQDEPLDRDLYIEKFQNATLEDIHECFNYILNSNNWSSAAVLPEKLKLNAGQLLSF